MRFTANNTLLPKGMKLVGLQQLYSHYIIDNMGNELAVKRHVLTAASNASKNPETSPELLETSPELAETSPGVLETAPEL